jgi:hypothetical protein
MSKKVFKSNKTYIVRSGPDRSLYRLVSSPREGFTTAVTKAIGELHSAFIVANARVANRTIADEYGPKRYQDVWLYPAFEVVVERLPYMGGDDKAHVTIREIARLPWERARKRKK